MSDETAFGTHTAATYDGASLHLRGDGAMPEILREHLRHIGVAPQMVSPRDYAYLMGVILAEGSLANDPKAAELASAVGRDNKALADLTSDTPEEKKTREEKATDEKFEHEKHTAEEKQKREVEEAETTAMLSRTAEMEAGVFSRNYWKKQWNRVEDWAERQLHKVEQRWHDLTDWAGQQWNHATHRLAEARDWVVESTAAAWESTKEVASNAWEATKDSCSKAKDWVAGLFDDAPQAAVAQEMPQRAAPPRTAPPQPHGLSPESRAQAQEIGLAMTANLSIGTVRDAADIAMPSFPAQARAVGARGV